MSTDAGRDFAGTAFTLVRHPDSPDVGVHAIDGRLAWQPDGALTVWYVMRGDLGRVRIPPPVAPARRDELWRRTCFELFVGHDRDAAYREFNLSPSGEWAAYAFRDYRERVPLDGIAAPRIQVQTYGGRFEQDVTLPGEDLPAIAPGERWCVGVSAVLESADGALAYWALAHAPGKPDFHCRAAFALRFGAGSEREPKR